MFQNLWDFFRLKKRLWTFVRVFLFIIKLSGCAFLQNHDLVQIVHSLLFTVFWLIRDNWEMNIFWISFSKRFQSNFFMVLLVKINLRGSSGLGLFLVKRKALHLDLHFWLGVSITVMKVDLRLPILDSVLLIWSQHREKTQIFSVVLVSKETRIQVVEGIHLNCLNCVEIVRRVNAYLWHFHSLNVWICQNLFFNTTVPWKKTGQLLMLVREIQVLTQTR